MPEEKVERNLQFVRYLNSLGFIIPTQFNDLEERFADNERERVIFDLCVYFQRLQASEWYDLGGFVYDIWLNEIYDPHKKLELAQKPLKASPGIQLAANHNKTKSLSQGIPSNGSSQLSSRTATPFNANEPAFKNQRIENHFEKHHKQLTSRNYRQQSTGKNTQDNYSLNSISTKFTRLTNIITNINLRIVFKRLQTYSVSTKKTAKRQFNETQNEVSSPIKTRFDRLYEDHILQQENQSIRAQIHEIKQKQVHPFSPKINHTRNLSQALSEALNTPVFERLSKVKSIDPELFTESQENRELKQATFSPKINQLIKHPSSENLSPPKASLNYETISKFYQNTFNKDKQQLRHKKYITSENSESHGHRSTTIQKSGHSLVNSQIHENKVRIDESVERLHSEAALRERKIEDMREELEYKKLYDCTFKPKIVRAGSAPKTKNAHQRLYGEAQKRLELQTQYQQEMAVQDRNRSAHSPKNKSSITPTVRKIVPIIGHLPLKGLQTKNLSSPKALESGSGSSRRLYEENLTRRQSPTPLILTGRSKSPSFGDSRPQTSRN